MQNQAPNNRTQQKPPQPQRTRQNPNQIRRNGSGPNAAAQRTRTPAGAPSHRTNKNRISAKQMQKRRVGAVSAFAVCLIVTIFVSIALLVVRSVDWHDVFSDHTRMPFSNPDQLVYGPYITDRQRDAYLTQYVSLDARDVYRGVCILVNPEHPYHFSETDPDGTEYEDVFSIYKNKSNSYKVSGGGLFLQMEAIMAMNQWFDAFYAQTENRNIMVNTAYRTMKMQKEIYDSFVESYGIDYANAYAQQPGFSEHHTGYAMDLAVYDEGDPDVEGDEAMWKFNGKDEYFWAAQNCTQYGFILRYSASKEDVTGISYESWHYRYVGIGNALTIQNMGLALEEYINFIKDYAYDGTRYYITAENGDIYCQYYVPYTENGGSQLIPVPRIAKSYQISGNNLDGFIVSALVGNASRG